MFRSGLLKHMAETGVDALDCVSVDNALALPGDPLFAGHCWLAGADCGAPSPLPFTCHAFPRWQYLRLYAGPAGSPAPIAVRRLLHVRQLCRASSSGGRPFLRALFTADATAVCRRSWQLVSVACWCLSQ